MITLIGLASAGAGYLVNVGAVRWSMTRKEKLLIRQDYEHQMYYLQYTKRVRLTLKNLLDDMDRTHRSVFGAPYPDDRNLNDIVDWTLAGVDPTFCARLHSHITQKKVTPDRWVICETGNPLALKTCEEWKKVC